MVHSGQVESHHTFKAGVFERVEYVRDARSARGNLISRDQDSIMWGNEIRCFGDVRGVGALKIIKWR